MTELNEGFSRTSTDQAEEFVNWKTVQLKLINQKYKKQMDKCK